MRRDGLIFGVAGTFFGVLIGWILGSQHGAPAPTVAAPVSASAEQTPAAPAAPPLDVQRATDLERIAKAQPTNATVRVELGDVYFDARQFSEAIPWYAAALKLDPKIVDASTDLAVCYYYTNDVDRALTQLDHSLSLDPRHAKTLLNQGIVRAFGKGDLKGAGESWTRVVEVAPNSAEARRAQQGLDGLASGHADTAGKSGGGRGGLDRP